MLEAEIEGVESAPLGVDAPLAVGIGVDPRDVGARLSVITCIRMANCCSLVALEMVRGPLWLTISFSIMVYFP